MSNGVGISFTTAVMSNKKYIVDTDRAPRAIGPHSQAVGYEGLLFISGQTAVDARTGQMSNAGVEQQARMVMDHVQSILMAAGLDTSHVLRSTVYLRNMNDYDIFNDIYALYFDHSPPARTVVEVSRLPKDALVSVDIVAAAPADYTSDREDASYDETAADAEVESPTSADEADTLVGREPFVGGEETPEETAEPEAGAGAPVRAQSDVPADPTEADAAPPGVVPAAKKTLPFGTIPSPRESQGDEQE